MQTQTTPSSAVTNRKSLLGNLTTFVVGTLLLLILVIGVGEQIHGQLLRLGEVIFGDPAHGIQYSFLRGDPENPACDPNENIDKHVAEEMKKPLDEMESLLGDVRDPAAIRASILSSVKVCQEKHAFYVNATKHITTGVKAYRTFEEAFFALFKFGTDNRSLILVLLVAVAAVATTTGLHHIAIRPPASKRDFEVYGWSMIIANLFLVFSCVMNTITHLHDGIGLSVIDWMVLGAWIGLFSVMALISIYKMFFDKHTFTEVGNYLSAFACVPLFAFMSIAASVFFLFFIHYPTGMAIYIGGMTENAFIFISLALYVWSGMLLKQTNLIDTLINVFRPFHLAPETLTYILMLGSAFATAYTGASGIFVIAAGSLIYREVLHSGARKQYALATTAMSGSLGVVLSPCLLIVLISMLNSTVLKSDDLYHYGFWVFLLSSTLFFIVSLILAKEKFRLAPLKQALPKVGRNLILTLPYLAFIAVVLLFYYFALNTKMTEFTAPLMLPLMVLAMVFFDQKIMKKTPVDQSVGAAIQNNPDERYNLPQVGFVNAVVEATRETKGHIGALLVMMALSFSMGGLVTKSEVMSLMPMDLGSTLMAITVLMIVKVLLGMIMDPFGAVILVTVTLAPIAYHNGIHPIHFWMLVLTAFELGYLVPPVALNQLLARLVVGEDVMKQADAEVKHLSFFWRYERWVLPVIVMSIVLLIVSYVPYFFKMFGWYH